MFKRFRELGAGLFLAKCLKVAGLRLEDAYLKKKRYGTEKNKVFDITVDDIKFKMSFKDYEVNKAIQERIDGVREPETTSIIRSMLKPGDNVLELGGCYGYFTQIMADSVGRSGKIVSIDGLPNNFKILDYNIKLNSLKNVECFNYFIGSKGKSIDFELDATSPYAGINDYNNGAQNGQPKTKTVTVSCINIVDFLNELEFTPTHIFMDIEGFEVDVIEQLSARFLNKFSPTLVFEHHEVFYKNGKGLDYMRTLLESNGYITRKVYGNIVAFKQ